MARLIDADEFMKNFDKEIENGATDVFDAVENALEETPTIEAEPVKQGKWLCEWDSSMGTTEVTCSVCKSSREILGCYVGVHGEHLYDEDDYCPKCGARMDGE